MVVFCFVRVKVERRTLFKDDNSTDVSVCSLSEKKEPIKQVCLGNTDVSKYISPTVLPDP